MSQLMRMAFADVAGVATLTKPCLIDTQESPQK